MAILLKNHLLNDLSLSLIALILSFGVWHTLSRTSKITASIPATVYFYNTLNRKIRASENIPIKVYGKRSDLKRIFHTTSLHIDASNLTEGTHTVAITKSMFNIPEDSILLSCQPELTITMGPYLKE